MATNLHAWSEDFTELRYSNYNLHRMCVEGITRVLSGEFKGVYFKLMNLHELEVVQAYMLEYGANVPYTWSRVF